MPTQLELDLIPVKDVTSAISEVFVYQHGAYGVEAELLITEDDILLESLLVVNGNGDKMNPASVGVVIADVIRTYEIEQEMKATDYD